MSTGRFVMLPTGTVIHTETCRVVLNWQPPPSGRRWFNSLTSTWEDSNARIYFTPEQAIRADTGGARLRRCRICVPDIPEWRPAPKRPRRTGLGWPSGNGACV